MIVQRPHGKKVLTGKWVFKWKLGPSGKIVCYKARFIARGFKQLYGIDFDETFISVVKAPLYHLFFALQARFG